MLQRRIVCCSARLEHFCEVDAYWPYDYLGGLDARANPNVISRLQLERTNSAMKARTSYEAWAPLTNRSLPELISIPTDVNLITSSEADYLKSRDTIERYYQLVVAQPGITDMAASKLGHLHRPALVAISDSYVRSLLGIPDSNARWGQGKEQCVGRGLDTLDAVRGIGQTNQNILSQLSSWVETLSYGGEPARLGRVNLERDIEIGTKVSMSEARILDIILWTEHAINSGDQKWEPWWQGHFMSCPKDVVINR